MTKHVKMKAITSHPQMSKSHHQPPPPLNEHKPLNHPKKPDLEERKKTTTTIITFGSSFNFFPTFDGSIVTLGTTNILFYRTFLIFGGTLIFTHI